MSDAMGDTQSHISRWLAEQFSAAIERVFECSGAERPAIAVEIAPAGYDVPAGATWLEITFSGICAAKAWAGVESPARQLLASALLGDSAASDAEAQSGYQEILGQCAGLVAGAVTERTGAEISVAGTQEVSESQAAGDGQVAIVAISHERLFLRFSPEWSMVLTPRDGLDKLAQAVGSATQVPPVSTAIATSGDGPGSGMSVLLDVELPVSVSFGKTRLPLKDVLKLTTGSVIELNRVVNEPVEVVVNNCVVATGDVVMVDGNYGVRIRKVLSSGSRVDNYALRRKVAAR